MAGNRHADICVVTAIAVDTAAECIAAEQVVAGEIPAACIAAADTVEDGVAAADVVAADLVVVEQSAVGPEQVVDSRASGVA